MSGGSKCFSYSKLIRIHLIQLSEGLLFKRCRHVHLALLLHRRRDKSDLNFLVLVTVGE